MEMVQRGDISLPPCLACSRPMGIETRLTKATHEPKVRGTSFCTTLWHCVQRYCYHFLVFIAIQFPELVKRIFSLMT